MSIVCVLIPRFELLVAAAGAQAEFAPLGLAPEPDREQVVGEVSGAAEAQGVHRGMRLGEALSRCPDLRLLAADPDRAASAWESVLSALEEIGAAVEPGRPGEAYFDAGSLRRLYGGHLEGVLERTRRALGTAGRRAAARNQTSRHQAAARLGAGPSRFCSFAAAGRVRAGRAAKIVPAGAARTFLAPLPVGLLRSRLPPASSKATDIPTSLERLGVRTLGGLAALPAADVADRFGRAGLFARELVHGLDTPLRPRALRETMAERIDLPEAVSGFQLDQMLLLLIDRLLARPERRGRAFRKLRLGARFVEQGTWCRDVALRAVTAERDLLRLALAPKLGELPAPIEQLSLTVISFGPPVADQLRFSGHDGSERRRRLVEALRQTRAAAGADSLLRVLEVDPGSRVPERRALLTPFPEA